MLQMKHIGASMFFVCNLKNHTLRLGNSLASFMREVLIFFHIVVNIIKW